MLVVRRAYDDGVDVPVRQQIVIVAIACDAAVRLAGLLCIQAIDQIFARLDTVRIQVADGHNACPVELPDAWQVVRSRDTAYADCTYIDPLGRRRLAQSRPRHNGRKTGTDAGCTGRLHETSAR
jgi:hypothetical protein